VSVDPDPAATGAPPERRAAPDRGGPEGVLRDGGGRRAGRGGRVFELSPGEILAVVGESGSGKSVTAMTLMGLTRSPNADFEGTAHYKGTELVHASRTSCGGCAERRSR
jgi:ABC-type phosphonate transport system ATPase subunit